MGWVWVEDKEDDERFKSEFEKKISETTSTLDKTNKDLLDEVKKLKKKVKDKESFTVDGYNELKNKVEKMKKEQTEGGSELEKQMRIIREQMDEESKKNKDEIEKLKAKNKKSLIKGELAKALAGIKVKPSLLDAAEKIIKNDISVIEEDGEQVARIGGKTITEHVKAWAETEEGKNFVLAPSNAGGDSTGNDNSTDESDVEKYFKPESKNVTQQILLKKKNKELYDRLKKKYS